MTHPYHDQPDRAFWHRAIGTRTPEAITDWYRPKFSLQDKAVATAGSCFAQHIGRRLRDGGFDYLDLEPAPMALPLAEQAEWGYGLYSARYGNVYTSRQLLQLLDRATGAFTPREDHWEKDGGIVDPFRPTIEPEPFGSVAEMRALRADHLEAVAEMIRRADVLVFTLGLTESWLSHEDGACFPLCPGTAGGRYDATRHRLHNLSSADVRADIEGFLARAKALNPRLEVLLTVSPVSLMATATEQQVAVATVYSKSVLRAVAGELEAAHDAVDYFPSYEIVTGPAARGQFYKEGMREVSAEGVSHVMGHFLASHPAPNALPPEPVAEPQTAIPVTPRLAPAMAPRPIGAAAARPAPRMAPRQAPRPVAMPDEDDVKCDEELLNSFGRKPDA